MSILLSRSPKLTCLQPSTRVSNALSKGKKECRVETELGSGFARFLLAKLEFS